MFQRRNVHSGKCDGTCKTSAIFKAVSARLIACYKLFVN